MKTAKQAKKMLLLYISEDSGHHRASLAIEKALIELGGGVQTMNVNSFNYTNPILEKVINKTYMSVIKRTPEIWDYLYDNPNVLRKTQRLREMIHKFNTGKLKSLLDEFVPDCVVSTQAFPCGMMADYKKTFGLSIPLVGVLTDYAPHSYWIYDNVDRYVVPSDDTGRRLVDNGVAPEKIFSYGIPIDPKFAKSVDIGSILKKLSLDRDVPCVLIMGGSQGLGPIKEVIRALDRSFLKLQIIVVTGTNKKLYRNLSERAGAFQKKVLVFDYASNVDELMQISTLVITKAGGITTAEALAKGIPMLIVNPLPGQEAMNTKYLLSQGVAVRAENPQDTVTLVEELLYSPDKLRVMSDKARALSRPHSALDIAKMILELADT